MLKEDSHCSLLALFEILTHYRVLDFKLSLMSFTLRCHMVKTILEDVRVVFQECATCARAPGI